VTYKFFNLSSIIIIFCCLRYFFLQELSIPVLSLGEARLLLAQNAETQYALGLRIKLQEAELSDIEMIPGMNLEMAIEMLDKKAILIEKAAKLSNEKKYKSFEIVKGVAEKKAKLLANFISPE